jgi:hypothetical protein
MGYSDTARSTCTRSSRRSNSLFGLRRLPGSRVVLLVVVAVVIIYVVTYESQYSKIKSKNVQALHRIESGPINYQWNSVERLWTSFVYECYACSPVLVLVGTLPT